MGQFRPFKPMVSIPNISRVNIHSPDFNHSWNSPSLLSFTDEFHGQSGISDLPVVKDDQDFIPR
jgi:hypothetical protein